MKALLTLMGILSFLLSAGRSQTKDFVIDLRAFVCGHTKLGTAPDARDFFAAHLKSADVYESKRDGFEAGTKQGVLDYVYITIGAYKGSFARNGAKVALDAGATPDRVRAEFGEPYWIDARDDEMILFYVFDAGKVELQFEFPDKKNLGFITLMRDGVLSDAEQRRHYGVTKAWPPKND